MSESIYNLVPVEYVEPPKPKMYRSKHDPKKPVTGSTFGTSGTSQLLGAGRIQKKDSATFGKVPKTEKPDPRTYLKAGEKLSKVPARPSETSNFQYDTQHRKPHVPKRDERPVLGLATAKNFITANAVEVILQVPKVKATTEPDYLNKADYGKAPEYLKQIKQEIHTENEMIQAYVKEQMGLNEDFAQEEELSHSERCDLIDALKTKWDFVNANYQKMTHNTNLDTVGKVKRKEAMEQQLKSLESDISKLENPHPIFITYD